jgi:hypothetical protein
MVLAVRQNTAASTNTAKTEVSSWSGSAIRQDIVIARGMSPESRGKPQRQTDATSG